MLSPMTIQFRLKELLARHERLTGEKLTYRSLAVRAGITPKMVNDVANQKVKHIGLSTIDRLCEALGVEPGELIVRVIPVMRLADLEPIIKDDTKPAPRPDDIDEAEAMFNEHQQMKETMRRDNLNQD